MNIIKKLYRSWFVEFFVFAAVAGGLLFWFRGAEMAQLFSDLFLNVMSGSAGLAERALDNRHDILKVVGVTVGGLGAFYLVSLRILWRMRHNSRFGSTSCPKCRFPLSRIKRSEFQKILSRIFPVRRYYCTNCKWKGLRLKPLEYMKSEVSSSISTTRVQSAEKIRQDA